jgi:hypothetical protein
MALRIAKPAKSEKRRKGSPRRFHPTHYVWHDSTTGLNHRTESLAEAMAFDAEQAGIISNIDAAVAAARIERRICDESGKFAVWVEHEG